MPQEPLRLSWPHFLDYYVSPLPPSAAIWGDKALPQTLREPSPSILARLNEFRARSEVTHLVLYRIPNDLENIAVAHCRFFSVGPGRTYPTLADALRTRPDDKWVPVAYYEKEETGGNRTPS